MKTTSWISALSVYAINYRDKHNSVVVKAFVRARNNHRRNSLFDKLSTNQSTHLRILILESMVVRYV